MLHIKNKYKIVFAVILTMLLQIAAPVAQYVYAETSEESLQTVEEKVEDFVPAENEDENAETPTESGTDEEDMGELTEPEEDGEDEDETPDEPSESGESEDADGEEPAGPVVEDDSEKSTETEDENGEEDDKDDETVVEEDGNSMKQENDEDVETDGEHDLSKVDGFNYEINLYIDKNEDEVEDDIDIENLTALYYEVKFTIDDGFIFVNGDYLNLDISPLSDLPELNLETIEGRIIFEIEGSDDVDAAAYEVEDGTLKIIFDQGKELNSIKDRIGYAELMFSKIDSTEEVEVIEEIVLIAKETKTFTIIKIK